MKKKIVSVVLSLVLCVSMLIGTAVGGSAVNVGDIIGILTGSGTGSINLTQAFSQWLKEQIDDESIIDKFVDNLKEQFGAGSSDGDADDELGEDIEDAITLDKAEAANIAELYNITVNELKKAQPAFSKMMTATMSAQISSSLQAGLGPVTGIVESLIGQKDIFAGVIDGTYNNNSVTTHYTYGNDVKTNLPVSGKNYVAALTAEDIADYTITIYRSGAYKMHVDLVDAEGSAAASGLSHVFDTTDKAYATLNLGTSSININVKLKYVNNYVECTVNRNGELTNMVHHMGITFLFPQEDGSYSPEMPYLGVNFEEEGIIYEVTTEYTGIDFSLRQMGDATNDGKVNSTDARTILRYSSGLEQLSEGSEPYCDVNRDGRITAGDARLVLRAASRLETLITTQEAFGVEEYKKSESVERHVSDLLVLIMAYQQAKDEEEQNKLQQEYLDKYENGGSSSQEEQTTEDIYTTGDKVNDFIDGIGSIIGGLIGNG